MNVVVTVLLNSTKLLLWYHISKHVKGRCKTDCKVKALNYKEGKEVKSKDVWKTIIDAWQAIVEFESKEIYLGFLRLFKIVCTTFQQKKIKICGRYYIGDDDVESGKGLEGPRHAY